MTEPTTGPRRIHVRVLSGFSGLGAAALLGQVLLLRETLVLLGGNEMVLGTTFGLWLVGIAVGAASGGRLSRRVRNPASWLGWMLAALGPLLVAQIALLRELRAHAGLEAGTALPLVDLLVASPAVLLPLPFVVGAIFPLGCRVARRTASGDVPAAGGVYVAEAAGSLVAGLGYSFLLAGRMSAVPVAALAGVLAAGGALTLIGKAGRASRAAALVSLLLGVVVAATPLGAALDGATVESRWRGLAPDLRLVESAETRYGTIEIGEREEEFSLYLSGGYATSFPDPRSTGPVAHIALCAHPEPRTVLVVGGGTDGLLQAMLRHPLDRLDHAETDPAIAEMVRRRLPVDLGSDLDDPRLRIIGRDGRRVVHGASDRYDVVVVNVPEPASSRLNRFYTVEFLHRVRSALRHGGILVLRTAAPAAYVSGERGALLAVLWRTVGEVFPSRRLVLAEGGAFLLGAGPDGRPAGDPAELGRRYADRRITDETFCPEGLDPRTAFEDLVFPGRAEDVVRGLEGLAADVAVGAETTKINSDDRPVAMIRALVLADRSSGGRLAGVLRRVEGISPVLPFVLVVGVGVAFVAFVLLRPARSRARALAGRAAVATTGFAAMGLQLALLLRLQGSFGHVYGLVGAVVAVFMAGLAGGGLLGSRRPSPRPFLRLAALEAAVALLCLAYPWFLTQAVALPDGPALAALLGLAVAGGLLTGLEFPAAVAHRMAAAATTLERAAGGLDAADHAGAAVGALVTGVVLLPALGLVSSCALAATLNAASLLALVAASLRR